MISETNAFLYPLNIWRNNLILNIFIITFFFLFALVNKLCCNIFDDSFLYKYIATIQNNYNSQATLHNLII